MRDKVNILEKWIENKNKDLIFEEGGSQDAVTDFEWAVFEGIEIIDYDEGVLELILEKTNYDIEKSISLVNKCLNQSIYISKDLVNKAM